jgi:hypothetical protein
MFLSMRSFVGNGYQTHWIWCEAHQRSEAAEGQQHLGPKGAFSLSTVPVPGACASRQWPQTSQGFVVHEGSRRMASSLLCLAAMRHPKYSSLCQAPPSTRSLLQWNFHADTYAYSSLNTVEAAHEKFTKDTDVFLSLV